jgi:hypothetical protein
MTNKDKKVIKSNEMINKNRGFTTIDIIMVCVFFWFCTTAILDEHRKTRNFILDQRHLIIEECSINQEKHNDS